MEQNGINKAYQRENIHFEIEKSISGYYRLVLVAKTKSNSINLIDDPASEDMYDYDVAVEIFNQFIDENFVERTLNVINRAVEYNLFLPGFATNQVDSDTISNILCDAENIIFENVPIERKEYCKLNQSTQGQFYTWNDGEDDHTVSGDICHYDGYNIDGSKCTDGIVIYDLGIDKDAKVVGLYETFGEEATEEEKTDSDREERTIKVIGVGELTLSMWYNEKENKHIIDVFNENKDVLGQLVGVKPEDLYDDDIIIEKLKETEIVLARSLEDLILGEDDIDGLYAMTLDGIIAVYKVLYNDDIEKMIDFVNYVVENAYDEEVGQETLTWAKMFMADRVFEETTEREFVEAVESGEFMNYICGNAFENFDNYDYDEWAWEVKSLIK